jgi:uncharacterized LabA/DUF88 family protein
MTNVAGWMLFVDGENFTIRAQELARQEGLPLDISPTHHLRDVFVWFPGWGPLNGSHLRHIFPVENTLGTRAYYYASVVGDNEKVAAVRRSLRDLGFDPQVFKRPTGMAKSKGVDITLTKDMLSHAFQDHYDDAVLIAGDGDYVPLVGEVKRQGKRVYVGFFERNGLGLSEDLRLTADLFADLTPRFVNAWRDRIVALERAKTTSSPPSTPAADV